MKKIFAIVLISILVFSCNNSKTSSSHKQLPNDTVRTVALYVDPSNGRLALDFVFKILADTLKFENVDSSANEIKSKKVWSRDSAYYVPVYTPQKDSTGKEVKDSAGNTQLRITWQKVLNNNIVNDYNKKYPFK